MHGRDGPSPSAPQIRRRLRSRSQRRDIRLGHATINDEIRPIDERALIRGKEQNRLRELNRLPEPSRGEMDLAPHSLLLVIAQPVLQKRRVQRRGTQRIEAESFFGVDDGQLARHGQHGAFGGRIRELRRCGSDQCHDGGGVDDASAGLFVAAEGEDGVFAAEPDAFDVDVLGEIPDLLWRGNGVLMFLC